MFSQTKFKRLVIEINELKEITNIAEDTIRALSGQLEQANLDLDKANETIKKLETKLTTLDIKVNNISIKP